MKDTLKKSLLLETLKRLGSEKKTGLLLLTGASQEIKIYLERGAIVFITGSIKEARLEYLLIRNKLFSVERIKDLLLTAKKKNQPLLQLLLTQKLATPATLEKLMAVHARYIILKALSWPNGSYAYEPVQINAGLATKIRYDSRQLVADIIRAPGKPTKAAKSLTKETSEITGPTLQNTVIQKMKDLPPMLQTVFKAKKIIAGEDTDFEALQRILETDQSMVAKILKIANSPFYGMSGKISSLKHSIAMLGLETLSQVITLAGTGDFLNQSIKGYGLTSEAVREHSLAVGIGSQSTAALVNPAAEDDAFVAGLLHDAGKIMLNPYVAEGQIFSKSGGQHSISDLEKHVVGCDHSEIAADVFSQWHFPVRVVEAIRYHHIPEQSDNNELAYILNAVDVLAKIKQDDIPIYEISSVIEVNVSEFLGLVQDDIAAIFNEMKESEKDIVHL